MMNTIALGLSVNDADKLSTLMDNVVHNDDCSSFFSLVSVKQHLIDTEQFEVLRDLKILEDFHQCPIPFTVRV